VAPVQRGAAVHVGAPPAPPPPGYTRGEFARLLGIKLNRLRTWERRGWVETENRGHGPGRYHVFSARELAIARRVMRIETRHGGMATRAAFAVARARVPA
jgi:hypothetical protein